jgi:hypothetical protein
MSKSFMTILAAMCLMLNACGGGGGSTEPRCCATLEGTWVGTEGDLTLRIVVGPDVLCPPHVGYCEDTGTGTYSRSGGDSGSFVVSGTYYVDIGQSATITMSDSVTNATTIFGGTFESARALSGMLYAAPDNPGLFGVGQNGLSMTLNKQ